MFLWLLALVALVVLFWLCWLACGVLNLYHHEHTLLYFIKFIFKLYAEKQDKYNKLRHWGHNIIMMNDE